VHWLFQEMTTSLDSEEQAKSVEERAKSDEQT
jgi:hypothetical protein